MIIASKKYNKIGEPTAAKVKIKYPARTNVGSTLKYSAIPPQTPASFASFDFVKRFIIHSPQVFFYLSESLNKIFPVVV